MNQVALLHLVTCKVTVSKKRAESLLQVFVRTRLGSASWYLLLHSIYHNLPHYLNPMEGMWSRVGPARRHEVGLRVSATGDLQTPLGASRLSSQLPVFSPLNQNAPDKENFPMRERQGEMKCESTSLHTKPRSIKFRMVPYFNIIDSRSSCTSLFFSFPQREHEQGEGQRRRSWLPTEQGAQRVQSQNSGILTCAQGICLTD